MRPRFFDSGLQRPAMLPPCATSSGATSTGPLAAGLDPPRRARCTGPLLRRSAACYDGLNRRRTLSTTSGSADSQGLARLARGSYGGDFHSLSQSQHVRFLCLRPTLILCVLRVSRTLAERGQDGLRTLTRTPELLLIKAHADVEIAIQDEKVGHDPGRSMPVGTFGGPPRMFGPAGAAVSTLASSTHGIAASRPMVPSPIERFRRRKMRSGL